MSSVFTPRPCSTAYSSSPKSSPTGPDHAHVGEEARRQREVHGGAAEHALALPEGRLDRVEGDRSDHNEAHSGGNRTSHARAVRAVQIEEFGGPEVLRVAEVPAPEPGEGEVLVRVERAGVNFGDTHQRENHYVAERDAAVRARRRGGRHGRARRGGLREGERVVALLRTGGYAEYAVAPRRRTFRVPDGLADDAALALLIQGLTAWHLLRTSARLAEGESVVVHSAAGGVGGLAVQLARPMGAGRVIATAGLGRAPRAGARAGRRRGRGPRGRGPDRRAGRGQRGRAGGRGARDRRRAGVRAEPRRRWRRSAGWWPTATPRARRCASRTRRC